LKGAGHLKHSAVAERVLSVCHEDIRIGRNACSAELAGVAALADCRSAEITLQSVACFYQLNLVGADDVSRKCKGGKARVGTRIQREDNAAKRVRCADRARCETIVLCGVPAIVVVKHAAAGCDR